MVRRSGWIALFFFALVPGLAAAFGQAAEQHSPQTTVEMPKHSRDLMLLGAQVNGFASADMSGEGKLRIV